MPLLNTMSASWTVATRELNPTGIHVMQVITKGEAGGAQTHVLELCRALQDRVRFSAAIGDAGAGTPLGQSLSQLGIAVTALPSLGNSLKPLRLLAAVRDLLRVLRAQRPDVLHVHSAVAGVVARIAGKISQTPVVYTVHGFGFKPQAPRWQRLYAWWAEALLAAWTTRMICVSTHELTLSRRLPLQPERVSVVANALADRPERAQPERSPAGVVMVARMAPPKRQDLLLQALAVLRDNGLQPATRLLGAGPLMDRLQQQLRQSGLQHVTLKGDVDTVAQELAEHQVFVLLSDHEGLPISVIEAMRAGLAILASRLPGIEELIRHEQTGLLVENTPESVAMALGRLLQDAALRQRLGAAARAQYEVRFQPPLMATAVMRVYQEASLQATARWPMTLPGTRAAHLGSEQNRRQRGHMGWSLLGLCMMALAYAVSVWSQGAGWVTHDFGRTVLACLLPYAVAARLIYSAAPLPAAERSSLLAVTTALPFLLTPLGFALLQQPYSRGAVLLCGLLTWWWFWLAEHSFWRHRPLRLLVLQPDLPDQVHRELDGLGAPPGRRPLRWLFWPAHWRDPADIPASLALDGVVLLPDTSENSLAPEPRRVLTQLKLRHARLYASADLTEALSGRMSESRLRQTLWQPDSQPAYDLFKRVMDVTLVLALLPLWLPLGLCVALAVRLDSAGPALFSQWRTGLHGQPFRIWKFRTMHPGNANGAAFAQANDPRITRLGRRLRTTRLDEIPQLFNVLRGDMSLIGPRPEQTRLVETFARDIPSYPYRHLVRPGLTGWAQVQQGYAASEEETRIKLSHDLYYVSHYSLAMDLLIVLRTVRIVLTGHGAR
jgi:lipopolysaccharide/colanic/teichoic acid biosynthesis glycosyltransferase/glycosyltransferase involved in cell wall biosynthesis